jgi:hypothetical protein
MLPSVLMTRPGDEAAFPRSASSAPLGNLPGLTVQELANLPAADLARLKAEVEASLRNAKAVADWINGALDIRYGARALQARAAQEKDTGTVRLEDNGFVVVADLPKRIKWDQQKLKELVELIRSGWGEDPTGYVKIKYDISERAYEAWPPMLRELFSPARTVETGKPSYDLLPPDGRGA